MLEHTRVTSNFPSTSFYTLCHSIQHQSMQDWVLTRRKIIILPLILSRKWHFYGETNPMFLLRLQHQYLNVYIYQGLTFGIPSFCSQALVILTLINSIKHTQLICRHFQDINTSKSVIVTAFVFVLLIRITNYSTQLLYVRNP